MPIELTCPGCKALLTVPDGSGGRQTRCPSCSAVFTAPPAPADIGASPGPASGPTGVDGGNPYAPTYTSAPIQLPGSSDWAPRQITYEEVFSKAWAVFKNQWVMVCVAMLIVGAVNLGVGLVQSGVVGVLDATNVEQAIIVVAQVAMSVLAGVVRVWLAIGLTMVLLDIARGREINLGKIFGGGPLLLKTVLAVVMVSVAVGAIVLLLIGVPAAVVGLAMQDPAGVAIGGVIGLLIAIVPIIIVMLMFSQARLLIVDRGLDPVDALRTSHEITSGNKFTLFVIGILMAAVSFVAMIAGILALCVGVIPAMIGVGAFGSLLTVVTYLCMTGQQVAIERTFVSPAPATDQQAF